MYGPILGTQDELIRAFLKGSQNLKQEKQFSIICPNPRSYFKQYLTHTHTHKILYAIDFKVCFIFNIECLWNWNASHYQWHLSIVS